MKRIPSVALGRHLLVIAGLVLASTVGNLSAADTYYVSDHLATTSAVADAAGEIAALETDAFGSPVSGGEQAARYTGKPYDADIGAYVFPFRNYRSEEARWMSADPSGFPDGLNGIVYSTNPLAEIDPDGLDIIHINNSSAVGGNGHSGAIIGSGNSWTYNSYGSGPSGSGSSSSSNGNNLTPLTFTSQSAALSHAAGLGYNNALHYTTTAAQTAAAQQTANSWQGTNYNVFTNNCVHMVNSILQGAGIQHDNNWVPNTNFNRNVALGNGTRIAVE